MHVCAKILHQPRTSVWNGMLIILIVWYERSYCNKNNTDDNYDSCGSPLFFQEILSLFFWSSTRGHDIKHLIFSEFGIYRLDLSMVGEVNVNGFHSNTSIEWTVVIAMSISSILVSFMIFTLFYEKPWSSHGTHSHTIAGKVERCKFWSGESRWNE